MIQKDDTTIKTKGYSVTPWDKHDVPGKSNHAVTTKTTTRYSRSTTRRYVLGDNRHRRSGPPATCLPFGTSTVRTFHLPKRVEIFPLSFFDAVCEPMSLDPSVAMQHSSESERGEPTNSATSFIAANFVACVSDMKQRNQPKNKEEEGEIGETRTTCPPRHSHAGALLMRVTLQQYCTAPIECGTNIKKTQLCTLKCTAHAHPPTTTTSRHHFLHPPKTDLHLLGWNRLS